MSDIDTRIVGKAGRITLQRPDALNAATYDMLGAIEAALDAWEQDTAVALVVIDALGERAFCAGGDIAEMYARGKAGDFAYGRQFWRDEYRLNAMLAGYNKPIVTFLQGFTMGGGVGIGCHASHRIVGESSQIAMPECGIGLVPDVGGSLLLARAPGRLGEYLGLTGARMGPGDAIYVGFADHYIPLADWPDAIAALERSGDPAALTPQPAPPALLAAQEAEISALFCRPTLPGILALLDTTDSPVAQSAQKAMLRGAPLSMACALRILGRVRADPTIQTALREEYRFTWRASEDGDFLEGIRAQIIDRDRAPKWRYGPTTVPEDIVAHMTAPLGADDLA